MLAGFTPSLVGQWYGSLMRLWYTAIEFGNDQARQHIKSKELLSDYKSYMLYGNSM